MADIFAKHTVKSTLSYRVQNQIVKCDVYASKSRVYTCAFIYINIIYSAFCRRMSVLCWLQGRFPHRERQGFHKRGRLTAMPGSPLVVTIFLLFDLWFSFSSVPVAPRPPLGLQFSGPRCGVSAEVHLLHLQPGGAFPAHSAGGVSAKSLAALGDS